MLRGTLVLLTVGLWISYCAVMKDRVCLRKCPVGHKHVCASNGQTALTFENMCELNKSLICHADKYSGFSFIMDDECPFNTEIHLEQPMWAHPEARRRFSCSITCPLIRPICVRNLTVSETFDSMCDFAKAKLCQHPEKYKEFVFFRKGHCAVKGDPEGTHTFLQIAKNILEFKHRPQLI